MKLSSRFGHPCLVEQCGDLDVMKVPDGFDPAGVRRCAEHPLAFARPHPQGRSDTTKFEDGPILEASTTADVEHKRVLKECCRRRRQAQACRHLQPQHNLGLLVRSRLWLLQHPLLAALWKSILDKEMVLACLQRVRYLEAVQYGWDVQPRARRRVYIWGLQ